MSKLTMILSVLVLATGCFNSTGLEKSNSVYHQTGTTGTPSQTAAQHAVQDDSINNPNRNGAINPAGTTSGDLGTSTTGVPR